MSSVNLLGGIKGWVASGKEYTNYMDEYDPAKWDEMQDETLAILK